MKKTLLIAGMIAAPLSTAVAKIINFDTPVEWNSKVIEQALNKAGFIKDGGANWDVRVTHDRILQDLLKRKSFSLKDATQVCLNKCNMSDFLKNGRGASGKKCPELCEEFTKALQSVNNTFKSTGAVPIGNDGLVEKRGNGMTKMYSKDKQFYMLYSGDNSEEPWVTSKGTAGLSQYKNICKSGNESVDGVVFDAKSNKPIALMTWWGEDCALALQEICKISDSAYVHLRDFMGVFGSCCSDDCRPQYLDYTNYRKFNQEIYAEYKNGAKKLRQALASVPTLSAATKKYTNEANSYEKQINEARDLLNRYDRIRSVDENTDLDDMYNMESKAKNIEYISKNIENLNECVADLVQMNGQTIDYSNIQTKTDEKAYEVARRRMNTCDKGRMVYADWKSKITCKTIYYSSLPGKDDKIQCTYKDITVTFIFDDIRNKSVFDVFDKIDKVTGFR